MSDPVCVRPARLLPSALLLSALLACGPLFGVAAHADSVSDLVQRAKTQAAENHLWTPPGDNAQETVEQLMGRLKEATPDQLQTLAGVVNQLENTEPSAPTSSVEAAPPPPAETSTETSTEPPQSTQTQSTQAQSTPAQTTQAEATQAQTTQSRVSQPQALQTRAAQSQPASPQPAPPQLEPAPARPPPVAPQQAATRAILPSSEPASSEPATPQPAPQPAAAAMPAQVAQAEPPPPLVPGPRDQHLYALGQQAEQRGDVSAARRFNTIAARDNYPPAALALGQLYDPAYLSGRTVGGVAPDIDAARYWYARAVGLGQIEATPLLTALPSR